MLIDWLNVYLLRRLIDFMRWMGFVRLRGKLMVDINCLVGFIVERLLTTTRSSPTELSDELLSLRTWSDSIIEFSVGGTIGSLFLR